MKNTKRAICYIFAIFLALQSFYSFIPAKANLPTPQPLYNYSYNSTNKKIEEKKRNGGQTEHTFTPSDSISAVSLYMPQAELEEHYQLLARYRPVREYEGMMPCKMDSDSNLYLMVRVKDQTTMGIWKKSSVPNSTFWNYLYASVDNDGKITVYEVEFKNHMSSIPLNNQTPISLSESMKTYIHNVNGGYGPGYNGNRTYYPGRGVELSISGLFPATDVPGDSPVRLCAKAPTIDFSKSVYFDRLPNDIKSKFVPVDAANPKVFKWPDGVNMHTKLFFKYQFDNLDLRASFHNSSGWTEAIEMNTDSEGDQKFGYAISKYMRGLPTGKYRFVGEFFLRVDNVEGTTPARFDAPGDRSFWDYWSAVTRGEEKGIEFFQTQPFEVEVNTSRTQDNPAEGISPNCANLTFGSRGTINNGLNTTTGYVGDGKTVCDKLEGNFIVVMLKTAFCGLMLITKEWADYAYNGAMKLLADSIGVATDDQYKPQTDSIDALDVGPNKTGGGADDETGAGGGSSVRSTATSDPGMATVTFPATVGSWTKTTYFMPAGVPEAQKISQGIVKAFYKNGNNDVVAVTYKWDEYYAPANLWINAMKGAADQTEGTGGIPFAYSSGDVQQISGTSAAVANWEGSGFKSTAALFPFPTGKVVQYIYLGKNNKASEMLNKIGTASGFPSPDKF